jgi:hypothetical protein
LRLSAALETILFLSSSKSCKINNVTLNVAKARRLQILSRRRRDQGIAVGNHSFTLDALTLKPFGFPRCFQGEQHGTIDPILYIHRWGYQKNSRFAMILIVSTN